MNYTKSSKYSKDIILKKIMGPNPIKLEEELLSDSKIKQGSLVMDLGSGQGLTSVFLAKEYGYKVFATDLWSDPTDNMRFFEEMGLTSNEIIPIHADANELPFPHELFDAVVCTDSYNYFGRDAEFLDSKLVPYVKHGGYIYIAIPGMIKDCHDNLPPELLLSWNDEQLDYIHDVVYWRKIIEASKETEIISLHQMESNEECWNDWLECNNEYAQNDRKAIESGGNKYMNFIAIILKRK